MSKEYSNSSIKRLKGADRVRLKPGVMLGSDGIGGVQQTFFEVLSNSLDEFKAVPFTKPIEVTLYKDKSIKIKDHGRGVPMDYNKAEDAYNWDLVFNELYAGGKYEAADGTHEDALGTNGLGATSTQYASRWFKVESIRDGYKYTMNFERGEPVGELTKEKVPKNTETGTQIHWLPDTDVFTDINITMDYLKDVMKRQAVIAKGVTMNVTEEATGESFEYYYEDGIQGYVREESDEYAKLLTLPVVFEDQAELVEVIDNIEGQAAREIRYNAKFELLFAFSNDMQMIEYYHNSSPLEYGGSPDRALKNGLVTAVDREIRRQGKYKAKESRIKFTDLEESLVFVSSTFSSHTSYENQTKKAINNTAIQEHMTELIKNRFETWFVENMVDANRIIDQILANKRSRETAERTRILAKKKLTGGKADFLNPIKKFVNCKSKDVTERELYIIEGKTRAELPLSILPLS